MKVINNQTVKKIPLTEYTKIKKLKSFALNPLIFHSRFQHITEQIFDHLDKKSLKRCRTVAKSWQNCIDNRNILWKKIANAQNSNKVFRRACKKGHLKIFEMLIQKPLDFNINFNATNGNRETGLHLACTNGHIEIARMLILKSTKFNIGKSKF